MVEGARLESVCTGNCTEGSNPSLSAIYLEYSDMFLRSGYSAWVLRNGDS